MRTGDEPTHARSALRLRLALAGFGLLSAVAGAVLFARLGSTAATVGFAALGLVALVDLSVVAVRIRQGPHYQPGPEIPPYHPVPRREASRPGGPAGRGLARRAPSMQTRRRRYLLLMGACVVLLVLAWGWVRTVSTSAAVVLTVVAMVIPPLAAVVANAGSPITRSRNR